MSESALEKWSRHRAGGIKKKQGKTKNPKTEKSVFFLYFINEKSASDL